MAMTTAEIQARLVKINAAIDAIIDGKASQYSINGRSLTKLSIKELEDMRTKYEGMLASSEDTTRPGVVQFGEPSS